MKKHLFILTSLGAIACCILTVVMFFHGPAAKADIKYDWKRLKRRLPFIDRSNVKHLSINAVKFTKQDLELIKTLHNLERLCLNGCDVDDGELYFIEGLTKLEFLSINSSIKGAGLVYLKSLNNLEYLELSSRNLTDKGLIHLSELHKLRRLRLSAENITGSGFQHLKGLKNLRHLTFFRSGLNDEGMKHVAQLKQLQSLYMGFSPPATEECLKYLTTNYQLECFGPPDNDNMSNDALREFRDTLLKGRRAARKRGEDVPRDDKMHISDRNKLLIWQARYNSGPSPAHLNNFVRKQKSFWRN